MRTYFMLNSHLQSESWEISPPIIGPRTKATARVAPIMAPMRLGLSTGPTSTRLIWVKLYRPEAPIPWKARQTILHLVSRTLINYMSSNLQCDHRLGRCTSQGECGKEHPGQDQHVSSAVDVAQFWDANCEACIFYFISIEKIEPNAHVMFIPM